MTDPAPTRSSPAAMVVALVAALAGVSLIVFGIVRMVGSIESGPTPTTVAFVTTTGPPATTASVSTEVPASATPSVSIGPETDFTTVTDESGRLSVDFPSVWTDVSGGGWTVDGVTVGLSVSAAVDRDAWYDGWGTPGAFIGISEVTLDEFTPELIDFAGACRLADTGGREYPGYTTVVQEWVECGEEGSQFTTALVWPSSFEWSGLIQIVSVDGTATPLLDRAIATLSYEPTP